MGRLDGSPQQAKQIVGYVSARTCVLEIFDEIIITNRTVYQEL